MKCQYCEKPATFHITELAEPNGPTVMHLCEEHARGFLQKDASKPTASIAGVLAQQLQLGQTKQELAELDQKECPVCGISFFEFRNSGRLGCPYDYTHFEEDLVQLLSNVHDSTEHSGKRPNRAANANSQAKMIQLRREMEEAVEQEDYERASEIRDELKALESSGDSTSGKIESTESSQSDAAKQSPSGGDNE